jgi:hypothetical protein
MSTQSSHNFKTIYEFTIDVPKEVEREESVTEGDVTTIKKIKEIQPTPVWFCFKKPTRHDREEADLYRTEQWTKFMDRNILPEAILLKKYANYGGILNDFDKEKYAALRTSYVEATGEYQLARVQKKDEEALKLLNQVFMLRDQIIQFEREQNAFFENTAESKARTKLTEYSLLNYSYTKSAPDGQWVPYFKGATLDEKYDNMDALEETGDVTYYKVRDKLLFVASLYVAVGTSLSKEDVDAFEKQQASEIENAVPSAT